MGDLIPIEAFNSLSELANEAVSRGVVPGLAVSIGQGKAHRTLCFGNLFAPAKYPNPLTGVDENTIYDLASLTKALCTSVLAMIAVQKGTLDLQAQLRRWLPAAPVGVTLCHLLEHSSGWPSHRKFYESLLPDASSLALPNQQGADSVVSLVQNTPLECTPGTRTLYSDLGFIALGHVLQSEFKMPLNEAFLQHVAGPLETSTLRFGTTLDTRERVAPTEQCQWRRRLLLGEVHDQNAWLMGGVAGHAGLFGTANDVAMVLQSLVRTYMGDAHGRALVSPEVLRHFWDHHSSTGTWALGWDRPSVSGSLAGALIDRRALGHLAFTGCSIWADPFTQTQVVILSNRIHPVVLDDPRFRQLRPALMDAALEGLKYKPLV
jgi:serine-type D-Ala-D-Ala carboxypeptidase